MTRAVLISCLPWLALLAGLVLLAWFLARTSGARPHWARLRQLHRDQGGAVQSLSFVLTLPLFIMVVLFILQVSQLMIGTVVVHYAAFAAARTAVVWIPARLGSTGFEGENCISWCVIDPEAPDQVFPILDPLDPDYGPTEGGLTYLVVPGSEKYDKIRSAAALGCAAICPSRDLGLALSPEAGERAEILNDLYRAMVPGSEENARVPRRIENKLAYAMEATEVEVRFYHSGRYPQPPLVPYYLLDENPYDMSVEYMFNELGWQDSIMVKVKHELALLPGPGRLLARRVRHPSGSRDRIADSIERRGQVYVYPLEASITLGNEGQKSRIPYEH